MLEPDAPIRISRLIARLNESLDDETVVIADIGDALFAATELVIRGRTEFLSPAYYTSMGFSVPAALGTQIARPDLRTVVIVGDGAFQMTGMELSTLVRHKFPTIVIVLDNGGYGTERFLHPGTFAFNDIHPWAYHKLPEVSAAAPATKSAPKASSTRRCKRAWADTSGLSLIQVHLDRGRSQHGAGTTDREAEQARLATRCKGGQALRDARVPGETIGLGANPLFQRQQAGSEGSMPHFSDQVIVITGASSGIGRALAVELAPQSVAGWCWPPATRQRLEQVAAACRRAGGRDPGRAHRRHAAERSAGHRSTRPSSASAASTCW